jgi:hypothetical protein
VIPYLILSLIVIVLLFLLTVIYIDLDTSYKTLESINKKYKLLEKEKERKEK